MPINPYTVAFANCASCGMESLTPRERREHDQLTHDARRRDWLAGRAAAKRAVSARCGAALDAIHLEPRVGGAPICLVRNDAEAWTPLPLSISIAHRDGFAIAAASDCASVGVDIERVGEIAAGHQRYYLAPDEQGAADATLLWVLKEAAWKALGLGPAVPFSSVQLAFAPGTTKLVGVWVESAWVPARARLMRLSRPRDLLAAVVEITRVAQ